MREARSAAALNHPNAVAIYDVVNHDERPWLVMEYVAGQTLADEIARDGRLLPRRVADIGAQLAAALAVAHERHIVHRDIKPANVLIDQAGRPKISDFGIARRHGDDQLTQTGFVTGTPGYLSPELARGGDPDWASDVWALGATLYAAVEGQPPYEPRSNPIALLMAIATDPPRPMTRAGLLGPAIEAMMHEDPARRWDMATSAQQLDGIASGEATAVMPLADPAPAATQVIATRPVEQTQRLEAAARVAPAAAAAAGRAEQEGPPDLHDGPSVPTPDDRRSGRRRLPFLVVALLLGVLGVAYLLSQLGGQSGPPAVLGATASATVQAETAPTTTTTPTTTTPTTTTTTTTAPTTTGGASPSSTTATPDPGADKRLADFVKAYYSDVTQDTNRTWNQLAPKMRDAAGGRNGYDGFWKTIDKVEVNQTQADASAKKAVANLTFRRDDGTTSTETHRFTFISDGPNDLIESDRNLG
jgi:serine/threonine protein kinase